MMMSFFSLVGLLACILAAVALIVFAVRFVSDFRDWKSEVNRWLKMLDERDTRSYLMDVRTRLKKLEESAERLPAIGALFDRVEKLEARNTNSEIEMLQVKKDMEEWKVDGRGWNDRIIALEDTRSHLVRLAARVERLEKRK